MEGRAFSLVREKPRQREWGTLITQPGFTKPEHESPSTAAPDEGATSSVPSSAPSDPQSQPALGEEELEAALQLLVERAQYITGATGAALALPHDGEMVCRASAGSCAPAVGARLQVRSGLTGESVSRRQLLRCDNAESDPRVNLEACRVLGIASIVVLPLVRPNGEVRGLFELFSDHPYAFEERDLVALERMAGLTSTALDLAEQRHGSIAPSTRVAQPEKPAETGAASEVQPAAATIPPPAAEIPEPAAMTIPQTAPAADAPAASVEPLPLETASAAAEQVGFVSGHRFSDAASRPSSTAPLGAEVSVPTFSAAGSSTSGTSAPESAAATSVADEHAVTAVGPLGSEPDVVSVPPLVTDPPLVPSPVAGPAAPASEPLQPPPAEEVPALETQSLPAPPLPESMLRVRKCASCGFPISEGRTLCLDCEKKQAEGPLGPSAEPSAALAPTGDLPPFLVNSLPAQESWLANHVNLLAILVFIVGILVAVVVFR